MSACLCLLVVNMYRYVCNGTCGSVLVGCGNGGYVCVWGVWLVIVVMGMDISMTEFFTLKRFCEANPRKRAHKPRYDNIISISYEYHK